MSQQSRIQDYKFQYKIISVTNMFVCGVGPHLVMSIPDNLLDIKSLFAHVVIKYDETVPPEKRILSWIGVDLPLISEPDEDIAIFVNKAADPDTRLVDLKIDLTHLRKAFMENIITTSSGQPAISIRARNGAEPSDNITGELTLWKMDLVYTTTGIQ